MVQPLAEPIVRLGGRFCAANSHANLEGSPSQPTNEDELFESSSPTGQSVHPEPEAGGGRGWGLTHVVPLHHTMPCNGRSWS